MKISKRRLIFPVAWFFCLFYPGQLFSQQLYINLNNEINIRIEKASFQQENFHNSIKPYKLDVVPYDSILGRLQINSANKLIKSILNNNLLEKETEKISYVLNPIIGISPLYDLNSKTLYNNYNFGVSVSGNIAKKISFRFNGLYAVQSFIEDINLRIDSSEIIPHFGKYHSKSGKNYHYSHLSGYMSYSPWKYLNLQLGVDKNFWGEGYRSLFLSDNSASYPFLKATVDIWKFKYLWLVGVLRDYDSNNSSNTFNNKLLFSHYLSWNATPWLNINFFESIISNPVDSVGINHFNVGYVNPVIFFRPTEFAGGSADNAILGVGFKLKLLKKYQFYSQFVVDEFVWSEMSSRKNWWGNKFGIQAGLKIFNLFNINNLYTLFEFNKVRPYTYSYSNSILNYGNQFQALAHPTGANFEELVFIAHYHLNRYSFQFKTIYSKSGMDTSQISYGKDIYKSYDLRPNDYGNIQGQGFDGDFFNSELRISWLINPKTKWNLFFAIYKRKNHTPTWNTNNSYFSIGICNLLLNNTFDSL